MKTMKRRMEYFSFFNHTGIEAHLAKMAKKGWMIESISNVYWTYRKIEPKDIHFSASYYPRASDFDPSPTEEQQTFHDFCAHTGWKLACTWFQMQVFYSENESPIPLDTDPIMEVDTVHRACKKNFLIGYFLILAVGFLMSAYSLAGIYFAPIDFLSSSSKMVILLGCLSMFVLALVELVAYFTWYVKAKKAAQDGIFVDTPSTGKFQQVVVGLLLFVMAWWIVNLFAAGDPLKGWIAIINFLITFGVIFLVNFIKQGLKKAKASRGLNRFLTFAACFILPVIFTVTLVFVGIAAVEKGWISSDNTIEDAIPFSLQDFIEIGETNYTLYDRTNQTMILEQLVVNHHPSPIIMENGNTATLRYIVTTINIPSMYEWCAKQIFRDLDETNNNVPKGHRNIYQEIDASPWGANTAYRLYHEEGWWTNTYLLCYDNQIIEIHFGWVPTSEDMAIVNQKLNCS